MHAFQIFMQWCQQKVAKKFHYFYKNSENLAEILTFDNEVKRGIYFCPNQMKVRYDKTYLLN